MIYLSLTIIGISLFFIICCAISHKIRIYPMTGFLLVGVILSIIGALTGSVHRYYNQSLDATILMLSLLVLRQTYVAYKRGFL